MYCFIYRLKESYEKRENRHRGLEPLCRNKAGDRLSWRDSFFYCLSPFSAACHNIRRWRMPASRYSSEVMRNPIDS